MNAIYEFLILPVHTFLGVEGEVECFAKRSASDSPAQCMRYSLEIFKYSLSPAEGGGATASFSTNSAYARTERLTFCALFCST